MYVKQIHTHHLRFKSVSELPSICLLFLEWNQFQLTILWKKKWN